MGPKRLPLPDSVQGTHSPAALREIELRPSVHQLSAETGQGAAHMVQLLLRENSVGLAWPGELSGLLRLCLFQYGLRSERPEEASHLPALCGGVEGEVASLLLQQDLEGFMAPGQPTEQLLLGLCAAGRKETAGSRAQGDLQAR